MLNMISNRNMDFRKKRKKEIYEKGEQETNRERERE